MNQNYFNLDVISKVILAGFAASWSIWNFFHTTRKEKTKLLTDMYDRYNSKEMVHLRVQLWAEIDKLNKTNQIKSFAKLWTEVNDRGEMRHPQLIILLYEFGAFWGGLEALNKRNLIDHKLAKDYFSYQYSYWKHHLSTLIKATYEMDADKPNIFTGFSSGELDWLEFSSSDILLYQLGEGL